MLFIINKEEKQQQCFKLVKRNPENIEGEKIKQGRH